MNASRRRRAAAMVEEDPAWFAALRERVDARAAARPPMSDAEAMERWSEAGRVLRHRAPELFACTLDVAEAAVGGLRRRDALVVDTPAAPTKE